MYEFQPGWRAGDRPEEQVREVVMAAGGYRTIQVKLAPCGLPETAHCHNTMELITVLEGDLYDDNRGYRAGDVFMRSPGEKHRVGSKNGCTFMIAYSPIDDQRH